MRSTVASFAAVAAALTALLATAAAPASAVTVHDKFNKLAFPAPVKKHPCIVQRRLRHLHGTYYWRMFSVNEKFPHKPTVNADNVTLKGTYTWTDCLKPVDPEGGPKRNVYLHTSALTNDRTNGQVRLSYLQRGRFGDGIYHWGSTLQKIRSR
jgi:hypothetical protein